MFSKTIKSLLLIALFLLSSKTFAGSFCGEDVASIPSNEAVVLVATDRDCFTNSRLTTSAPRTTGSSTEICGNYPFPSGFVITNIKGTVSAGIDCLAGTGRGIRYTISRPRATSSSIVTCNHANAPVPSGWVVVARGNSSNCASSGSGPTQSITVPGSSETVCQNSPVPNGFVVSDNNLSSVTSCSSSSTGREARWIIRRPANNIWVCSLQSRIPDGYAQIGSSSSVCTGTAYRIGVPTNNTTVCGLGNAPTGFIKTSTVTGQNQCVSGRGYRVTAISQISSNGTVMCGTSASSVPSGYVVTDSSPANSCSSSGGTGAALFIRVPSTSTTTDICSNYGYPAGYAVIRSSPPNSNCGAPVYTIDEIVAGNSYCETGFVLPINWIRTSIRDASNCPAGSKRIGVDRPSASGSTQMCGFVDQNNIDNTADVPQGYAVTSAVTNTSVCDKAGYYLMSIEIPSPTRDTFVCLNSPIPNGFAALPTLITSAGCSATNSQGRILRPLDFSGALEICVDAPIPDGYVVTAHISLTSCFGSGSNNGYRVEPADPDGQLVCADPIATAVPEGFVILSQVNAPQCGLTQNGFNIATPNLTGTTITCSGTLSYPEIPEGFSVVGTVASNNCGLSSTANVIAPAGFQLPNTFVDPIKNVVPGSVPAINYDCGSTPQNNGFINNQPRNIPTCN